MFGSSSAAHPKDLDFLDSGVGEFDLELVANPEHPKRFAHLFKLENLPDADYFAGKGQTVKQIQLRDAIFIVSALLIAISLHNKLTQWVLLLPGPTPMRDLSIRIIPPELIQAENVETTKEALEDVSQPQETQLTNEELVQEQEIEIETTAEELNIFDAPPEENTINLREQIPAIVRGLEPPVTVPPQEGLSAPGIIVDRHLREKLNSAEIAKLNRWRPPENAFTDNPGGRSLTKIGELCFLSGQAAQGGPLVELPLVGNGWNLNYYREVDCDNYFKAPQLNRSSVQPP